MGGVRELADRHADAAFDLDPVYATLAGIGGRDERLTDWSPEGVWQRAELGRRTLAELDGLLRSGPPVDDDDRRCAVLLRERLDAELALADAGEDERAINILDSPLQTLRQAFDLMATTTADDWEVLATRLGLPRAPQLVLAAARSTPMPQVPVVPASRAV